MNEQIGGAKIEDAIIIHHVVEEHTPCRQDKAYNGCRNADVA